MSADQSSLFELALSIYREKDVSDAYESIVVLLDSDPDNIQILNLAGACCYSLGSFDEAERYWKRVIDIRSDWVDSYNNLGTLYWKVRQWPEAAENLYRVALSIDGRRKDIQDNLIGLLLDLRKFRDAIEMCRRVMVDRPDDVELAHYLGVALHQLDQLKDAEEVYRSVLRENPQHHLAHSNLGVALRGMGRHGEAEQAYRDAIAICPDESFHHVNLSTLLLEMGRWDEGWEANERRLPSISNEFMSRSVSANIRQWQGEALHKKSLLVIREQGFGDEIQMARYVAILKKAGAGRIILACSSELRTLFKSIPGVDEVISSVKELGRHRYDFWTLIFSLPYILKTRPDSVPNKIPYISPSKNLVKKWRKEIPTGSMRVGLVWKGAQKHEADMFRSLSSFSILAPLWKVKGVSYISLQKERGRKEISELHNVQPVCDLGGKIDNFDDTAAIVKQLDLVITVDTSMAHLCGALGVPCWVLLSAARTDWRWAGSRDTSIWYPNTLKLYRQTQRGDWRSVVDNIVSDLELMVKSS
ncbi:MULTISPECIES: tetratricopeptide repeat protein [Burkholderia]|uniref:Putative TPR repeat protein n=1 Tax=Burkholderia paludis TaxID=1506587 RepID=A0A6J5DYK3_9BURK|nr:tetratricopeptide repeat protein [Burkholderia sp. MSh2]CAB3758082.1 hypothetical protein LMG30113_03098 [Burkholderia paludis]VWB99974.1 putative TPR repeat protein [Burkholderia paludis]